MSAAEQIPDPAPSPRYFEQRADTAIGPVRQYERVEIPVKSATSFGFDASLPADSAIKFSSKLEAWPAVRERWLAQITSEDLIDISMIYYRTPTRTSPVGWYLRETDGAFVRRQNEDAIAYTPRAWTQLVTLFLQEVPDKPRSPSEAYRWLAPEVRSTVFAHLRDRSRRAEREEAPMLLRTFISEQGVRALRAVVTGRHSGRCFDDEALSLALDQVLPVGSQAWVQRTIDRTVGHATLESSETASAVLYWSSSETGAASLAFGAGCRITALETLVRTGKALETAVDLEKPVTITTANGSSRRSHTLPRVGVTAAQRAKIARERMLDSILKASAEAKQLVADWHLALKAFPPGYDDLVLKVTDSADVELYAEIMLDLIESRSNLKADDREALKAIIKTNDQLKQLPLFSAAHIAGAWALLAKDQTDVDEAARLQLEAGRWIRNRYA
jgi:hypothetical protein